MQTQLWVISVPKHARSFLSSPSLFLPFTGPGTYSSQEADFSWAKGGLHLLACSPAPGPLPNFVFLILYFFFKRAFLVVYMWDPVNLNLVLLRPLSSSDWTHLGYWKWSFQSGWPLSLDRGTHAPPQGPVLTFRAAQWQSACPNSSQAPFDPSSQPGLNPGLEKPQNLNKTHFVCLLPTYSKTWTNTNIASNNSRPHPQDDPTPTPLKHLPDSAQGWQRDWPFVLTDVWQ